MISFAAGATTPRTHGGTARAVVVEGPPKRVQALLARALSQIGFWPTLARRARDLHLRSAELAIVIKPDLGGFCEASPAATDPRLVEAFLDLLHDHGYTCATVAVGVDTSALWAENREALARADLLGYRFVTPKGRPYDISDLQQDLVDVDFPLGATLSGTRVARAWVEAHVRIVAPKNRTDEARFYALALDSLIDLLPCVDKDYQYRYRRDSGDVSAEILAAVPPHLVVVDALRSTHGSGGARAPAPIETCTLLVATDPVIADAIGALKMGLDPWISATFRRVVDRVGLPARTRVRGSLAVYPGWKNVAPVLAHATSLRERWVEADRLVGPWLQALDPVLFPLKHPLDGRANAALTSVFAKPDEHPAALWLLALGSYGLAAAWKWLDTWRTVYDKDALRHRDVPLGLDLGRFQLADYEAAVSDLLALRALVEELPADSDGLRWRYVQESVVFEVSRLVPIDYRDFVDRVDVSRTIQFMNDYIGGVVAPVAYDAEGRVTHQAERNLYLPQPNYLVLSDGKPIDVTKLEFCEYGDGFRRMFWKTIQSENDSARYDDGIVTFSAHRAGTFVSIFGRQLFRLPPFWEAVQMELAPDLRELLVTDAYATFFRRTLNNFEALVEGRDIAIGRRWLDPGDPTQTEALPIERLGRALESWNERYGDRLRALVRGTTRLEPARIDADGFSHFQGVAPDDRVGRRSREVL